MGLFGKTKKEKEEEERIRIHQENLTREKVAKETPEKAATQERLSQLIAALEIVERMSPKWEFDGLDESTVFGTRSNPEVNVTFKSRDRFSVRLFMEWCPYHAGIERAALVIRRVNSDSTDSKVFEAGYHWDKAKKEGNYEEWKYLSDYLFTRIIGPEIERQRALIQKRNQSAKDEFWSK